MKIQYIQTSNKKDILRYTGAFPELMLRTDIDPLLNAGAFRGDRAVGIYWLSDLCVISAGVLSLNEQALTRHMKWALSSPLVHPLTIKNHNDLITVLRCEWVDDVLHHPGAEGIGVKTVMAYRIKCYLRKLFNKEYLPTPQVIIYDTSIEVEPTLTFLSLTH